MDVSRNEHNQDYDENQGQSQMQEQREENNEQRREQQEQLQSQDQMLSQTIAGLENLHLTAGFVPAAWLLQSPSIRLMSFIKYSRRTQFSVGEARSECQ